MIESWKHNTSEQDKKELIEHVLWFIDNYEITNSGNINECEFEDLLEFIEGICEIVGYYWEE